MDNKLVDSLKELIRQGHTPEEINRVLNHIQNNPKNHTSNKKLFFDTDLKSLKASQILLFVGGLITILAGIIYITINWQGWNPFTRIFAIFLPTVSVYSIGTFLWFGNKHLKPALAFLVTGSLLLPLFLSIFFKELNIFEGTTYELKGLVISFISLGAYLFSSVIFKNPIWILLYDFAGLFLYYFTVSYFNIDILGKNTLTWGFLILAYFYLFTGFISYKNRQDEYGRYPLIIGTTVSLFGFIYLIFSHPLTHNATWYLFIPTILYFWAGYYFETEDQPQNSYMPYFLGSFGILTTILKLSLGLNIINLFDPLLNSPLSEYSKLGFSLVIAGVIYLLISVAMEKAKDFNLQKLASFSEIFEAVGTVGILGGIFRLGMAGKKPIYETLLLLSSLGFIFLSIFKLSRSFLYLGTIFLVIYIFDIGGEYFQNQVGWPITLFIAGVLSMLVGFVIEKVRKNYFGNA